MRIIAILIMAAALVACGGSDSNDTGTDASGGMAAEPKATQPAAAPQAPMGGAPAVGEVPPPAPASAAITTQTCLSMIESGKLEYALQSCLAALAADPENAELQAAVEKARAAKAAAAGGATDAAAAAGSMADDAAAAAGSAADDAAAKLKSQAADAAAATE